MKHSQEKILTTHVGALPGPAEAWSGDSLSDDQLRPVVADVVAKQRSAGIDIINEGELTKGGNWVAFIHARLSGFEPGQDGATFALLGDSEDWKEFADFYQKADLVDVMLAVKAQTYLFEAANVRHEHEYTIWEDVELSDGKILAPGVVTHSTPLIEHPELVSQRIQRFAKIVGRENVIASTDCGLGLRCPPQVAWAKLKALTDGAALAIKALGYD
jgi:methionine synthase II (cobalamin-independent)